MRAMVAMAAMAVMVDWVVQVAGGLPVANCGRNHNKFGCVQSLWVVWSKMYGVFQDYARPYHDHITGQVCRAMQ